MHINDAIDSHKRFSGSKMHFRSVPKIETVLQESSFNFNIKKLFFVLQKKQLKFLSYY